ncbi:MAG: heat-inducible transcriptional repressor HrcA [Clostridiales bacterium]|nr:heat-inducible transcriptional repressor HrcA [Clostridiales bacterium]
MDLSERKRKILQAIIEEYITTAEPVGSRVISRKEQLGLSSATIRNEMADLEEMGYLIQPHTSAGRVPSDEGYRFYVNSLMQRYKLGVEAVVELQKAMEERVSQLEKTIRKAGALTSMLTEYASFVTTPKPLSKIRKLELIPMEHSQVMLIVVTHTAKSCILRTDLNPQECLELTRLLNDQLAGLTAEEISREKVMQIQKAVLEVMPIEPQALVDIISFVYDTISAMDSADIYLNNAKLILKYPEYSDVSKAREIFEFLEDKENLKKLAASGAGSGVNAKIGKENGLEILKDCSLVTVDYSVNNRTMGRLGVIGPKRMNYSKVFASLDLISSEIDKILKFYITGE